MTEAPMPLPDTERRPRTRITRLPYAVVALIALVLISIWGAVTWRERVTSQREVFGIGDAAITQRGLSPNAYPAPPTAPAAAPGQPAR